MARLQAPPPQAVAVTQQSTPRPAALTDVSDDAEAATQQLLDEVRTSASSKSLRPPPASPSPTTYADPPQAAQPPAPPAPPALPSPPSPPPQSSAVLGANLLNAARIEYHHNSPIRMAPRPSNGKLTKSGLFADPRRHGLARPRQRDVYDLSDDSPEKQPYRLHERVNRAPLKIVNKGKRAQQAHVTPSSEPAQAPTEEDSGRSPSTNEAPLPSSPPGTAPESSHTADNRVLIETHTRNGAVRCAVTSYRSDKPAGPRSEQCHNAGPHSTHAGPRCTRHLTNPGSMRCSFMLMQDGDAVQCPTAGVKGTARCTKHARKRSGSASVQKQMSDDSEDVPAPSKSAKVQPHASVARRARKDAEEAIAASDLEVQLPSCTKKRERPAKHDSSARNEGSGEQDGVAESIEPIASATPKEHRRTRSKAQPRKEGASDSRAPGSRKSITAPNLTKSTASTESWDAQSSHGPRESDAEIQDEATSSEEAASDGDEETNELSELSQALRQVFQFLKLAKRPRRCRTDVCLNIKSACDTANQSLRGYDLEIEAMTALGGKVQAALDELRNVASDDRPAVKADMYGYVFRSLTKLVKSLYRSWNDGADTLEAVRILLPLVRLILNMKDLMASWKVTVPQRYSCDGIIKDVDSHLIAPLRKVHDVLSKRLRQLESRDRAAKEFANEYEETERLRSKSVSQRDRWNRWQQLHIARMRCEPDASIRLPNLKIISLEDLEDVDANGVKIPGLHPSIANRLNSWSIEQEHALLDGLKMFAGPDVFDRIFEAYCRPRTGGLLRKFSVLDIVTKAAEFRSTLPAVCQGRGSAVPEWLTQIPLLP